MPIYEYKCTKCEKVFERIVSVADSSKAVFCDCSPKAKAKKIISAPSFRLEGSGWYETDFKTGNKKNLVQSEDKTKKTNKETKKSDNSKTSKKD
jgi:putative FmdB family regulatory protein|tara:strand:- start:978 stop:1259 length:282 start_codon:yes stop_codon:yes gene_type:complete